MKKALWTTGIIIVIIIGILFWQESKSLPPATTDGTATSTDIGTTTDTGGSIATSTTSQNTFRSADKNITFAYPNSLTVSEKNNVITLHHQIKYAGPDACDMRGGTSTSPTFTDFHVTMQAFNMNIASTAETVSSYIPKENFENGTLKVTPGFIDLYNNGLWNGYQILEGAEGCGQITYYLPISSSRTLVIQKMIIGAFSDVADPTNKQKILATPGVISPSQSDQIFSGIVGSLKAH